MRNKNIKKTGFTLAEMMVAMAIVGISVVVAMTTIRSPKDAALKYLYINAYNSLSKAYYNGTLVGYNPFSDDIDGVTASHEDNNDTGALVLCKGLTHYINTNTNEKTSEHDYSSTCRANNLSTYKADDSDFTANKVMFTATNGMRFFITKRLGGGKDSAGKDQPYFYLVYVDVNGLNGPNSLGDNYSPRNTTRSLIPDIFAFAILDSGRVCPLGIPEYDTDILTARFIYGPQGELISPRSFAYYQAKGAAWGFYGYDSNLTQDPMTEYNVSEPYSMNDKIRSMITEMEGGADSKIVKDFPNLWEETPVTLATGESPDGGTYDCSNKDLESCYIFLDEYKR